MYKHNPKAAVNSMGNNDADTLIKKCRIENENTNTQSNSIANESFDLITTQQLIFHLLKIILSQIKQLQC